MTRVLVAFALFLVWIFVREIVEKREIKSLNEDEYSKPETRLRFMIFTGKGFLDLIAFILFLSITGVNQLMNEQFLSQISVEWIFLFVLGFVMIDASIRYVANYILIQNGKPDILEKYNVIEKEDKQDE